MHTGFVLPYYGTTTKKINCLVVPNPNSYKQNNKSYSKVPINTHYFGKVMVYPITQIDTTNCKNNKNIIDYSLPIFDRYNHKSSNDIFTTNKYGKNKK